MADPAALGVPRLGALLTRRPGRYPGTSGRLPRRRGIELGQAVLQVDNRGATSRPGVPQIAGAASHGRSLRRPDLPVTLPRRDWDGVSSCQRMRRRTGRGSPPREVSPRSLPVGRQKRRRIQPGMSASVSPSDKLPPIWIAWPQKRFPSSCQNVIEYGLTRFISEWRSPLETGNSQRRSLIPTADRDDAIPPGERSGSTGRIGRHCHRRTHRRRRDR